MFWWSLAIALLTVADVEFRHWVDLPQGSTLGLAVVVIAIVVDFVLVVVQELTAHENRSPLSRSPLESLRLPFRIASLWNHLDHYRSKFVVLRILDNGNVDVVIRCPREPTV